ncbi:MAG: hypothetical protein HOG03_10410 [Desulfobacula sp.]|jgi:type I restriction enzyme, S subunit|uniref:restriction endonuclease subunit S n=1 Tax=Desulfobacula sp. TaxID=2593537 RepID=UPI001E0CFDDD|nr:hypothetical protein [Desulfobacula sp.]MBT4025485.1 hypothetical protein [Desulfobacula sp.]MBT6340931.1 hypothetical protein [Desulfobacula sp.]MBT7050579.1 hypothetical protein [Desulfobacula sp.]MBT7793326.1 hypothetical protein [Desulfobacula sp.]
MDQREGYKKTKLGWIPEDWDAVKLGKITNKVGSGITPRGGSKVYQDNGIPFFRSQNILYGKVSVKDIVYISEAIHQKMKNTQLQPADVLLNITGASIGRCCVFPNDFENGNVNQHVCIIRPDEIIKSKYLCYILNSPIGQNQIWNFQAGGNREGLNFQQIKSFIIPYPPLPEQKKIAEILTTIDNKISSIDNQIQQAEQLKKGLMEKLLTEGMGHTEFKDTKIGRMPKSWDVAPLVDLTIKEKSGIRRGPFGGAIKKSFFVSEGYKIYEQKNVIRNNFFLGNYFITEEKFQELKNFKVRARDLLISCSGTIGKIVEVPMGIKEGVINQALLRIRLNGDVINQGYFLHIFQSDTFQKKIIDSTQGGAMKNLIGMNEFRNVLFTRPPLEEQNQIASILSSVDDKIEVLTQKKYHYQTLKKGLSQQLLTGQMRVKV